MNGIVCINLAGFLSQLKLTKRGLPDSPSKVGSSTPVQLSDKEIAELQRVVARDIIVAVIKAHSFKQKTLRAELDSRSPKEKPSSKVGPLSSKFWQSTKTRTIYPTES